MNAKENRCFKDQRQRKLSEVCMSSGEYPRSEVGCGDCGLELRTGEEVG